jgi:uncharacterized protein
VKIVRDEPKRQATIEKHGFDFADLTEEFSAAAVRIPVKAGRFMAIGELGGAVVTVAAGLGTEAISVISMRRADRKERKLLHGQDLAQLHDPRPRRQSRG